MKRDVDWKILSTLGFLVATIAVPTVASLVSPEPVQANSSESIKISSAEPTVRNPASASKTVTPEKSYVITFDVRCAKNKTLSFKSDSTYVQLRGRDCGNKKRAKGLLAITNKSNGFTASIFPVSQDEYQTDLIQLKAGENQIAVQFQSDTGASETQVLKVVAKEI